MCGSSYAAVLDRVIVVVDDEIVTQREFDRIFDPIKQSFEESFKGKELEGRLEEARTSLLEQIINTKIAISVAKKAKIQVNEEELQKRLEQVKAYYGSEEEFLKALDERGSNLTEFKQEISEQIMAQQIVEEEVASKIVIAPSEINDLYEKNKEKFVTPLGVQVRSIMVRRDDTSSGSREKIDEIRTKALNGGDFSELAREFSEGPYAETGGEMGIVTQGQLLEELDKEIFSAKKGEITEVVETPIGYHVFLIEDIKEPRKLEMDEVSDFLRGEIFKNKFQADLEKWLKEKRANAHIAYK